MKSMHKIDHHHHRTSWSNRLCIICGFKAIGMNFGAPTCVPCKAFFRRNARRKEILQSQCHHPETNVQMNEKFNRYSQFRRCSSCRLRRCFDMGMKEELVRTDEENERHKQLVETNRKRRAMLKEQQHGESLLTIPQLNVTGSEYSLNQIDWRHLSNITYAYDTCCVKTYAEQRLKISIDQTSTKERLIEQYMILPISITLAFATFIKSLPAFHSLSRSVQTLLCKTNLRRLMFPNMYELNQSCFSEPWQIAASRASCEYICGPELFKECLYIERLCAKSIITDQTVTRLWQIKKKFPSMEIQNTYATLLWKYLLHRHGYMESVRIYSNLILVFLHMLRVGIDIHLRFRAQAEFATGHEILDQLATLDVNKPRVKSTKNFYSS